MVANTEYTWTGQFVCGSKSKCTPQNSDHQGSQSIFVTRYLCHCNGVKILQTNHRASLKIDDKYMCLSRTRSFARTLNKYSLIADNRVFAWKCHLAFIAPTNATTWSLSANDKFIEYTKRFDELAISIPCLASVTSISTAVILWGLRRRCRMNALEGTAEDDWENLNLMLIFQGVARSITDIEIIEHLARAPMHFVECRTVQLTDDKVVQFKNQAKYSDWRWLPAEPCTNKQFIGNTSNQIASYWKIFNTTHHLSLSNRNARVHWQSHGHFCTGAATSKTHRRNDTRNQNEVLETGKAARHKLETRRNVHHRWQLLSGRGPSRQQKRTNVFGNFFKLEFWLKMAAIDLDLNLIRIFIEFIHFSGLLRWLWHRGYNWI